MKIIDFDKKGNVVRYYLGNDSDNDYWGDDWDDAPYECNAGTVYDEYTLAIIDIAYPFNTLVKEPCNAWQNGLSLEISKAAMKEGRYPCIVSCSMYDAWDDYNMVNNDKDAIRVYFNQKVDLESLRLYENLLGGIIINIFKKGDM